MKPLQMKLLEEFSETAIGKPIEHCRPVPLSGWEFVEAVWPLNEVFRPHVERIGTLQYDAAFEKEADEAIVAFVKRPLSDTWANVAPGAWRVLLERHKQAIAMAIANEKAKNPISFIPDGLPRASRLGFAMLFLLYGMKLPFPVGLGALPELPEGAAPPTMRLQ